MTALAPNPNEESLPVECKNINTEEGLDLMICVFRHGIKQTTCSQQ